MEAQGRMKDAIEAGQQMVALESASAYRQLQRGVLQMRAGDRVRMTASLHRVAELAPTDAGFRNELNAALMEAGLQHLNTNRQPASVETKETP